MGCRARRCRAGDWFGPRIAILRGVPRWFVPGLALALCALLPPVRAQAPSPVTWIESRLTTDPADQFEAAVGDGKVVWTDFRNGNIADVRLLDLVTGAEREITSDPATQYNLQVAGDWVVHGDDRNDGGDVFAFHLGSGVETLVTTEPGLQGNPAISGDRTIWNDLSSGADLYARSLSGGPIFSVARGPRGRAAREALRNGSTRASSACRRGAARSGTARAPMRTTSTS